MTMWKVISPRCCRESAQSLMETLNDVYPTDIDIVINWGNSHVNNTDPINLFGNKLEAVARSTNKEYIHGLILDLGPVPRVTEYREPGVYQHHANLSDGRGVRFVSDPSGFIPGVFSTQRIVGDEYRAYFCYDMKPHIFKKIKLEDNAPDNPIQCSTNGYGYIENPKELRTIDSLKDILVQYTKKTARRLELSYGAVDFIVEKDTYMVYILETNSAPTLITTDLVLGFAEQINSVFGKDNRDVD